METRADDRMWAVSKLDKGTGLECPRDACGGKLLVNLVKLVAARRSLGTHSVICPYCECVSLLPEDVLPSTRKPKKVRRHA